MHGLPLRDDAPWYAVPITCLSTLVDADGAPFLSRSKFGGVLLLESLCSYLIIALNYQNLIPLVLTGVEKALRSLIFVRMGSAIILVYIY